MTYDRCCGGREALLWSLENTKLSPPTLLSLFPSVFIRYLQDRIITQHSVTPSCVLLLPPLEGHTIVHLLFSSSWSRSFDRTRNRRGISVKAFMSSCYWSKQEREKVPSSYRLVGIILRKLSREDL